MICLRIILSTKMILLGENCLTYGTEHCPRKAYLALGGIYSFLISIKFKRRLENNLA